MSHKPHWHPTIPKWNWAFDVRELLRAERGELASLERMKRGDVMRLVELVQAISSRAEKAKAEISRLTAEINAMKKQDWDLENDALLRKVDTLTDERDAHKGTAEDAYNEWKKAVAEITRLREVLERIAKADLSEHMGGYVREVARAALSPKEDEDQGECRVCGGFLDHTHSPKEQP